MSDDQSPLDRAREDAVRRYADVDPAEVSRLFDAIVAAYENAPVRTFLPVLAERELREQLSRH